MLKIMLTNGDVRKWTEKEYTDYDIKGRFFVVLFNEQWVGMYALDHIISVDVDR